MGSSRRSRRRDFTPALTSQARRNRVFARRWALQAHYKWETGPTGQGLPEALASMVETRIVSPARLPYVTELIELMAEYLEPVDQRLQSVLDHWQLNRISHVDRAALRIGAVEILYVDDVPTRVAIKEAIRLAEYYGGVSSPKFVNGVLDAFNRRRGLA